VLYLPNNKKNLGYFTKNKPTFFQNKKIATATIHFLKFQAQHKTTLKHSKQSHYILTDNILLSAIEKIATSYHTQPNFLPKV
jgi:hypothetical protein